MFGLEIGGVGSRRFSPSFQIQIWFARFPNSEVVVQFLYATALLFFFFMEEKRSTIAGATAGVALGSTLLARMENVLFLVPIALVMGWKRLTSVSSGLPSSRSSAGSPYSLSTRRFTIGS